MITGINTDVEFQGKIYHVQTEDIGKGNPTIVSILFFSGAILYKRKTSYAEKISDPNLPALLKDMMGKQHRGMLREVVTGQIFKEIEKSGTQAAGNIPKAALDQKPAAPAPAVKAAQSSPSKTEAEISAETSKDKGLDDLILDYLDAPGEGKKP